MAKEFLCDGTVHCTNSVDEGRMCEGFVRGKKYTFRFVGLLGLNGLKHSLSIYKGHNLIFTLKIKDMLASVNTGGIYNQIKIPEVLLKCVPTCVQLKDHTKVRD